MYNRTLSLWLVIIAVLQLTGCGDTSKKIQPSGVVVNVLDKQAYDDCHIKGSINVDYDEFKDYAQKHWNKDTTHVIVYCSNYRCSASLEAAKLLVNELGFNKDHVYAYEGGSALALAEGVAMQGACKETYLKDIQDHHTAQTSKDGIQLIDTNGLKTFIKQYQLP